MTTEGGDDTSARPRPRPSRADVNRPLRPPPRSLSSPPPGGGGGGFMLARRDVTSVRRRFERFQRTKLNQLGRPGPKSRRLRRVG